MRNLKPRSSMTMADRFSAVLSKSDMTSLVDRKNDKSTIELGYHKISGFVSDSHINLTFASGFGSGKYLVCSPPTNHDVVFLLNLVYYFCQDAGRCLFRNFLSFGCWFLQEGYCQFITS